MRSRILIAFCALALGLFLPDAVLAEKIDATQGRKYKLTKQHGPWMIMVATLYESPAARKKEGMTHEEAADKLVFELRSKSIPAYTFSMDEVKTPIETTDRQGRTSKRSSYRSQKGGICVVAGNYGSTEDSVAKKTLEFIKSYVPKSWKEDATFRATPGNPLPLSGAFLSINPMLDPEEVASRKRDPLLLKLNAGTDYSIMDNKGKYTLVIATFTGRSQTEVGEGNFKKAIDEFKVTGSLDDAGDRARKVAIMLREGMIDGRNKGKKYDAFVFHDRYKSVVTVGSFDSKTDPRIAQMADVFGAKTIAGQNGKPVLAGEGIVIPGKVPDPVIFDPKPKLIDVPKLTPDSAKPTTSRPSLFGTSKPK